MRKVHFCENGKSFSVMEIQFDRREFREENIFLIEEDAWLKITDSNFLKYIFEADEFDNFCNIRF